MRDVAGDLSETLHQQHDAIEHLVEAARQPVHLVVGAQQRDPFLELAIHNGSARPVDGIDAAKETGTQNGSAGDGENQCDDSRDLNDRIIASSASLML